MNREELQARLQFELDTWANLAQFCKDNNRPCLSMWAFAKAIAIMDIAA